METLREIGELVALQEQAIDQHPPETGAVYRRGRDAFVEGQAGAEQSDWSRSLGLSLDELGLMSRYMLSSSFISAYYHLLGDKRRRNQAAHSCATLIASLGPDTEQVFRKYLHYEQLWRETMRREGIAPRNRRTVGMAIGVGVLIIAVVGLCAR